ncbi:hypothetical protein RFI_13050, partial [Reticulomyxa filosa]
NLIHGQTINEDKYFKKINKKKIRAICSEAARTKRVVAAHCHGKEGILAAIRNGATTIEHGSYLDKECVELMKKKNMILVPTRFIVETYFGTIHATGKKPSTMSEEAFRKGVAVYDTSLAALKLAVQEGVTIACGTDMSFPQWGRNGEELKYYVAAGMTPLQAIETATANGPKTIGDFYAPKSGLLKAGYDADVIVLSKNPLDDITLLSDANNVLMVWKMGRLVKNISSFKKSHS